MAQYQGGQLHRQIEESDEQDKQTSDMYSYDPLNYHTDIKDTSDMGNIGPGQGQETMGANEVDNMGPYGMGPGASAMPMGGYSTGTHQAEKTNLDDAGQYGTTRAYGTGIHHTSRGETYDIGKDTTQNIGPYGTGPDASTGTLGAHATDTHRSGIDKDKTKNMGHRSTDKGETGTGFDTPTGTTGAYKTDKEPIGTTGAYATNLGITGTTGAHGYAMEKSGMGKGGGHEEGKGLTEKIKEKIPGMGHSTGGAHDENENVIEKIKENLPGGGGGVHQTRHHL